MRSSFLFFPALAALLFAVLISLPPPIFRPVASLPTDLPSALLGTATAVLGGGSSNDASTDVQDDQVGSGVEEDVGSVAAEDLEQVATVASFTPGQDQSAAMPGQSAMPSTN